MVTRIGHARLPLVTPRRRRRRRRSARSCAPGHSSCGTSFRQLGSSPEVRRQSRSNLPASSPNSAKQPLVHLMKRRVLAVGTIESLSHGTVRATAIPSAPAFSQLPIPHWLKMLRPTTACPRDDSTSTAPRARVRQSARCPPSAPQPCAPSGALARPRARRGRGVIRRRLEIVRQPLHRLPDHVEVHQDAVEDQVVAQGLFAGVVADVAEDAVAAAQDVLQPEARITRHGWPRARRGVGHLRGARSR